MHTPKIGFVSLGCPKALVDSERILTQLHTDGYDITNSYVDADVVIVNTCGFIDEARAESLEAIGEALAENGRVIVTGCLGKYEHEIRAAHPDVLGVTGPQQYEQVLSAVHEHAPISKSHDPFTDLLPPQGIKLTPRHYAYLKISEGCNHKCSFCIIPSMRGALTSRDIGDVMREAEGLVQAGVKELLVISQDTSAYGADIRYRTGFWHGRPLRTDLHGLVKALAGLGIWIRLHYMYPYPHVDEIVPLMADGGVLPYLDVPFQHGSPAVLKAMRRPAAAENTLRRLQRWREICPSLVIRSTFIVGFPGERREDFELLLEFLREAQLDRVGCFTYSPVAGARANDFPGHVPEPVKEERRDRFMQAQQAISREKMQQRVGQSLTVLVDEVTESRATGRSYADAPEIDGRVIMDNVPATVMPGDFVTANIEAATDHDLYGSIAVP